MARNKVVLFIVEGITDQESLQLLLEEFLEEEQEVKFEVVGGDITTDRMTNRNNIKKKIAEVIKFNMKRNKFLKSDYQEVIHLVDTDGVFIDEKYIFEDINLKKMRYEETGIYTNNVLNIKRRNEQKKEMLEILLSTKKVNTIIPYRVFYFSCNLDHVLHDEQNLDDSMKINYAEKFQDKYIEDLSEFIKFICESDFTVNKIFRES